MLKNVELGNKKVPMWPACPLAFSSVYVAKCLICEPEDYPVKSQNTVCVKRTKRLVLASPLRKPPLQQLRQAPPRAPSLLLGRSTGPGTDCCSPAAPAGRTHGRELLAGQQQVLCYKQHPHPRDTALTGLTGRNHVCINPFYISLKFTEVTHTTEKPLLAFVNTLSEFRIQQ